MSFRSSVRCAAVAALLVAAGCGAGGPRPLHDVGPDPLARRPVLWEPARDGRLDLPASPASRQLDSGLRVVTFNMHHRDKPAQLAAIARRLRAGGVPDFILCQEVLFERPRWQGEPDTARVLADALGHHARGTQRRNNREGVAIVSRYPFDYYDEIHLAARIPSLLLGFRRVSVMGEFDVPGVGRVRVVNVHLAHWPAAARTRRLQLEETLRWVAARDRRAPADVTILGGDFNMTPRAAAFAPLSNPLVNGELAWVDLNGAAPTFGGARPTRRIDYIFVAAPGLSPRLVSERLLFGDGVWLDDGSRRVRVSDHLLVQHEYEISDRRRSGRQAVSYLPPDEY